MNPQLLRRIGLGVLLVVLVVVVATQLLPVFTGTPPATPPATTPGATAAPGTSAAAPAQPGQPAPPRPAAGSQQQAAPDVDELLANVQSVDFDYNATRLGANMRNPMSPLIFTDFTRMQQADDESAVYTPGKSEIIFLARQKVLSGIIYNSEAPVAIIDDEVVMPGYEYPEGIVVDSITEDTVVLRVQDSRIERKLGEQ